VANQEQHRDPPHDLVAAYALDALDEDERRDFDAHLETCERCQEQALAFAEAAAALAYAPEGPAPPDALRGRILEAARAERGAKVIPFPRGRRPVWIASVAAAACLALGLGLWATIGQSNGPGRAQTVALQGYVGTLSVNGSGEALMDVRNLPAPPRGAFYQVWVIPGPDKYVPDVTFSRAGKDVRVQLVRPVSPGDTVGVTVERRHVSAPTSKPIITASLPA
jgi:anti-sigma-K factor RskA